MFSHLPMELLNDLIPPVTRDERQHESVTKWLKAKGHGTVVAGTGVDSAPYTSNSIVQTPLIAGTKESAAKFQ